MTWLKLTLTIDDTSTADGVTKGRKDGTIDRVAEGIAEGAEDGAIFGASE